MAKKTIMYVDHCAFKDGDGKDIQKLARGWLEGDEIPFFPDEVRKFCVVEHPQDVDEVFIIARFVTSNVFDPSHPKVEGLDVLHAAVEEFEGINAAWVAGVSPWKETKIIIRRMVAGWR
jgi:hypothetical protein